MVYTGALQRDYERLNMMTLQEFLEKQFDENLMLAVLSGQRSKEKEAPSKVRIRQIELKGSVCFRHPPRWEPRSFTPITAEKK